MHVAKNISGFHVLVLILVVIFLEACTTYKENKIKVGLINFCVPKKYLVKSELWWIPKEISKGGFRFSLPSAHELDSSRGIPLFNENDSYSLHGLVDERNRYLDWKSLPPKSQFRKEIAISQNQRLVAQDRYIETTISSGYDFIWKPGNGAVALNSKFGDDSELMSICYASKEASSGSSDNLRESLCSRIIIIDTIAVDYSFNRSLLNRIDVMDKIVTDAINSWRCT